MSKANINATNVVIGDGARQTIIQDGQPIELPNREDLRAYLARVQERYSRWADQSENDDTPLWEQSDSLDTGPDAYIQVDAKPLPMRVAEFREQPGSDPAPSRELLSALGHVKRSVILGEPGSGKTTALERLAFVTATHSLNGNGDILTVPILATLRDYQGEADLSEVVRRAFNQHNAFAVNPASTRLLLWAKDVEYILLLDGLNEFDVAYKERGPGAISRHLADYPAHTVHLTCRTADFDAGRMTPPGAELWQVQPLADDIRYWDDTEGYSDVRDYLRRHLGESRGKRLWERLRGDERLQDAARLPLLLWMCKEAGGDGELPGNRGELVAKFVRSERLLGRVPKELATHSERNLEILSFTMQSDGTLTVDEEPLYLTLQRVRGPRSYDLDTMRSHLQHSGLLVDYGAGRYRLLHQLVQEYGAAAHLAKQSDCAEQLSELAQSEWWRESCILALWLRPDLHTADYLQRLMTDPAVDLRVRVVAAEILADVGDPRFVRQSGVYVVDGESKDIEYIEPQMIPVPGGDATLGGDDPDAYDDEKPECTVPVAAFELARFPVTNAEFACFMEAGGYEDESLWTPAGREWLRGEGKLDAETDRQYRSLHQYLVSDVEGAIANWKRSEAMTDENADGWRRLAGFSEDEFVQAFTTGILNEVRRTPYYWNDSRYNGSNQPVVGVNWYEAMAYAAWLGRVTGTAYRLPTEAEWEWAARRSQRRFPWGDTWDEGRCNSSESRLNRPNPVGVYPYGATPDGIEEMAGNVYDWTATIFRGYPYDPDDGREDPLADGLRVLRGGSWYVRKESVRCADRNRNNPRNRGNSGGYRLARTLSR
jgi:formylglycine-generating enzyme required for sulfatase activity